MSVLVRWDFKLSEAEKQFVTFEEWFKKHSDFAERAVVAELKKRPNALVLERAKGS
jgi:hypothetical protein